MIHLRAIKRQKKKNDVASFPFNMPMIQMMDEILFTTPVTFLVGENGSGKSTILEAIAHAAGSITVGTVDANRDETLAPIRALSETFHLVWRARTRKGFFLRAEDFFGYVKRVTQMRSELEQDLRRVDEAYKGRSAQAKGLARMPYSRELHALNEQYGRSIETYSHGESFLELFQSRMKPNGLYLLDEPEAPLSPLRQLTFISLLKQMVAEQCQFIIATHSPIIMAFPGATILSFDETPIQAVAYDELEHVTIMRSFLNNPEQYLRHL